MTPIRSRRIVGHLTAPGRRVDGALAGRTSMSVLVVMPVRRFHLWIPNALWITVAIQPMDRGIVRGSQYHCDHNEVVELSVLGHKE
jgi:hypothetical protein